MYTDLRCLTLLILVVGLPAKNAGALMLVFDELPFQSIEGVSIEGVAFDFQVDGINSPDAYYGSFGPGSLETIADPSLIGDSSGILTLEFDIPTPMLEFGVALNTADDLSPGYTVALFDANNESIEVISVDTTTATGALGFSEGQFVYIGTPAARAVIDFADAPGNFAFDNLVYVIPEPSALAMLGLGFLMAAFAVRPRNARPR